LMSWKTADFMEERLGEEYDALIVSVQKFGFFVELTEMFVEGIVPMDRVEELTGERAYYREQDHAIVSGTSHGHRQSGDGKRAEGEKGQRKKSSQQSVKGVAGSAKNEPQPARAEQGRRMWKLGDRIRVRAERIDPIRRRVEFAPVE